MDIYQFLKKQEPRIYISKRADLLTLNRKNPFLPTFPNKAASVLTAVTMELHVVGGRGPTILVQGN